MTPTQSTHHTATDTLRIAIFGASGQVGQRLVAESTRRGHRVTAIARRIPDEGTHPEGVKTLSRDVLSAEDLPQIAADHDIVIAALRPPNGKEPVMVDQTAAVVEAALASGTRFIIVGGAAPLRFPDAPEHSVFTKPGFLPESVVPIATASQHQHDWLKSRLGALGTLLCPPPMLVAGERTERYRIGEGTLVVDDAGDSGISIEDFAVALLDEAEHPTHTGRVFTVAY
ncbi:MAG: NAD(P)H-binding protein [Phycisphaerales bacterium]|nr:NAD(P)H-binding protein [Phycisphaerales bacterium]